MARNGESSAAHTGWGWERLRKCARSSRAFRQAIPVTTRLNSAANANCCFKRGFYDCRHLRAQEHRPSRRRRSEVSRAPNRSRTPVRRAQRLASGRGACICRRRHQRCRIRQSPWLPAADERPEAAGAPFQALVMSEESRLGREAIETGYALKQLVVAGWRVVFYLGDREPTLDSPTDKIMMQLTAFADEIERDRARQ